MPLHHIDEENKQEEKGSTSGKKSLKLPPSIWNSTGTQSYSAIINMQRTEIRPLQAH